MNFGDGKDWALHCSNVNAVRQAIAINNVAYAIENATAQKSVEHKESLSNINAVSNKLTCFNREITNFAKQSDNQREAQEDLAVLQLVGIYKKLHQADPVAIKIREKIIRMQRPDLLELMPPKFDEITKIIPIY